MTCMTIDQFITNCEKNIYVMSLYLKLIYQVPRITND
uniref:Uncharacterized protein n=1 Tax=Arundo donax TaxID=35708 RepID=A0A0A9GP95_ARUDO